jgi:ribonuclease BN (tRNA processing enzyme)
MKLKAIGTGGPFCRHPLVTSSFLIQSETSLIIIGCGTNIPAKLSTISMSADKVDMWIILSPTMDQIGGLWEIASLTKQTRPFLVGAESVLRQTKNLFELTVGKNLLDYFETRSISRVKIDEEHQSESIKFIPNYHRNIPSYSLLLEESEIFISGNTALNDEFLHQYGAPAKLILHSCNISNDPSNQSVCPTLEELQTLPMYIQSKIWLYGYDNTYTDTEDPIPMLFLPQGTCIYDSIRKDKHLEKERFIRESSRRQLGNVKNS